MADQQLTRKQIAGAMALRKVKDVPKFGKEDVERLKGMFGTTIQSQLKPLEPLPEPTPYVPEVIQDAPSSNPLEWLVNREKANMARTKESSRREAYQRALAQYKARQEAIAASAKSRPMDEAVLSHELMRQKMGLLPGQMQPIDESQFQ